MFKKLLFAAAIMLVSSPIVSAQDIFFSFDENSRVDSLEVAQGTATGTVFLFGDENLSFNNADVNITATGDATIDANSLAGDGAAAGFSSFAFDNFTSTGTRFFAVSIEIPPFVLAPGQVAGTETSNFRAGANGFLLGAVDFDLTSSIGGESASFDLAAGNLGVGSPAGPAPVTFGGPTLTVEAPIPTPEPTPVVPEPSSTILLILGAAGMVARRKRS